MMAEVSFKVSSRVFLRSLRLVFLFVVLLVVFTFLSVVYLGPDNLGFIFSLKVKEVVGLPERVTPQMWLDSLRHGVLGFFLGILTLDVVYAVFTVFSSVLMDVDHVPSFLGLPVPARIAHSFVFLLFVCFVFYFLFRDKKLLVVWGSSFVLHISLDNLMVPVFSPFLLSPEVPRQLVGVFVFVAYFVNFLVGWRRFKEVFLQKK